MEIAIGVAERYGDCSASRYGALAEWRAVGSTVYKLLGLLRVLFIE